MTTDRDDAGLYERPHYQPGVPATIEVPEGPLSELLETAAAFYPERVAIDFLGLAVAGGLYIVPSFAAVQAWTDKAKRARVIGAVNVLTAAFMVAGTVSLAVLQGAGLSTAALIAGISILNLLAAGIILAVLPTSPFRDFLSILFRAFYRLEVRGIEKFGYRLLKVRSGSIANTIAAVLLDRYDAAVADRSAPA